MSEMIERVAITLAELDYGHGVWESIADKARYKMSARAAIEAMREPTMEMLSVSEDLKAVSKGVVVTPPPYNAWQAMIDASLCTANKPT